ncbi:MAG: FAD:protein FMN transferase [Lachnospiraceae bacterium]
MRQKKHKNYKNMMKITALLLAVGLCTGCAAESRTDTKDTDQKAAVTEYSASEESQAAGASATQKSAEDLPQSSRDIFAMDTVMSVTAYGEDAETAVSAAVDEINRLDTLFSVGNAESDIARLNTEKTATVSDETFSLVERSLDLYKSTEGALNITIYPLMEAWGFTTGDYRVPEQTELTSLLQTMQINGIQCDSSTKTITLPEQTQIDLGAIAKGYTSSRLMDLFAEYDVVSALVSLGGNVQVYSTKPDGSKWRVAVEDPFSDSEDSYAGILSLQDQAAITSGAYERYFEQDGVRYHHILDPSTGYPAESGLSSVTIVSADGTLADALSTALFVMGKDKAIAYWRAHTDEFDMVLIENNGDLTISEGLEDSFSSDKTYETVEREEK